MNTKDFYEKNRLDGNTENITGNPNPDYDSRFYSEIFDLMEGFAVEYAMFLRKKCIVDSDFLYWDYKGKAYFEKELLEVFKRERSETVA